MLQIWLPLNGTVENQGLLGNDAVVVSTTPAYVDNGKIGKAMSTGGLKMSDKTTSKIFNNKEVSIAFWIYPNVATGGSGGIIFGRDGMTAPNNRKFTLFQYPTANDLHWSWQNNETNKVYIGGTKNGVLSSYTWTHVCVTYSNPTCTIYINGTEVATSSGVSNSPSFEFETPLIHNNANRYMNDFRLYDHCLSPLEVKLLAQGLVMHFPLNDPYPTASINKYNGDTFNGKASYNGEFTVTKLSNENGYNYKMSYTGTGSNSWKTFSFPVVSFTPNKKYKFSCKVRKNGGNAALSLRAARIGNDWEASQIGILTATDKDWHEFSIIATMPEKYTRSGTTYAVEPRIEFYSPSLTTSGTVYTYDFDLKDMQISECDANVKSSNGSWDDGIVYDTSGYNNNGSVGSTNRPWWSGESPRYDGCYMFNGGQQIQKIANPLHNKSGNFSISFWLNTTSNNTQTIYTARSTVGLGIALFLIEGKFRLDDGSRSTFNNYSAPKSTWIHVVVVRDSSSKKLYVNGELKQTISEVGSLSSIGVNGTIGASESSDNGVGVDNYLIGSLSDFRLYATSLTNDDVKNLYTVPVSLTETGNMITRGEFIE